MIKFYRIKVSLQEPTKLSAAFKTQFKKELANNTLYLGKRFTPTNYNRSSAINSIELAYQCIAQFENSPSEYGPAVCYIKEYPCHNDFMKSIIDADSRVMQGYVLKSNYKLKANSTTEKNYRR